MTQIQKGDLNTVVATQGKDEFSALGQALNAMTAGLRERETVKKAFSHYVSRRVIDAVVDSGNLPSLQGVRRRITVLFCDIRGFTSMSEKMSPEAVVQFLNNHFETVVEIVDRNNGLVDKYIGDGIMVLFGAQDEDAYQEGHAVRTALQIRDELARRSRQLAKDGLPPVAVGIGINSGSAIVGNIGASQRLEYTAIGATVNLASRLETATRELDVDILISEYTQQEVRGKFTLNKIGAVRLKGREEPVMTYTIPPADRVDDQA